MDFLTAAGQAREFGLVSPGLGFDHYLDLRMDAADREVGVTDGTPRTIEGPLYVTGAPVSRNEARLDDGQDAGETLLMHGRVLDLNGKPVAGAVVECGTPIQRGITRFSIRSKARSISGAASRPVTKEAIGSEALCRRGMRQHAYLSSCANQ